MGQKVNPHGLRVGVIKDWDSKWYAPDHKFGDTLVEDHKIRVFLKKSLYQAGISKIEIARKANKIFVKVFTAKPGMLIGKGGAELEKIRASVVNLLGGNANVNVNIVEVKNPDLDAKLVAESIAAQLEKRAQFRRVMKSAMQRVMRAGATGVKTMVSGRLDGAEIARSEHYHEGSLPLQTLRANIDYAIVEAHTTFGVLGVKVWIYKGEILGKVSQSSVNHKKGEN